MTAEVDISFLVKYLFPVIFLGLFFLGIIENLFFVRIGGRMKRGLMVWNQKLCDDAWQFLSTLQEDIVQEVKVGLWYKKKSFISAREGEVLIRYGDPKQNTSWPILGYVNLSNQEHVLEYRMPAFMVLLVLWFVLFGVIKSVYLFSIFFLVIFAVGFFLEFTGLRSFVADMTDLYTVRGSFHKTNGLEQ